jgi:hypothetical protein
VIALSAIAFMIGSDIWILSSNMEEQGQLIQNQDLTFWAFVIRGGIADMFSVTSQTDENIINEPIGKVTDKTYFKPLWSGWFKSRINDHIEAERALQR